MALLYDDAGHGILVVPTSFTDDVKKTGIIENYLVSASVKTVIQCGYIIDNGYVIADIEYKMPFGVITPEHDYEF